MTAYRYRESGLRNVFIHNMEMTVDAAGDEVVAITNIYGLHRAIASSIVEHPNAIAPDELRFLRSEMGLTQEALATLLNKDEQTIARWEKGKTAIDPNAEALLRLITVERLSLDVEMSAQEAASRVLPGDVDQVVNIDGSDPGHYRPLAA